MDDFRTTSAENEPSDPILPGWPLYRTRPGRSGLDYLDTQFELGHMTGIFLRQLFSGSLWRKKTATPILVTLIVGVTLILAFPGNAAACPVYLMVLIGALVCVTWKKYFGKDEDEEDDE